ncbi:MAG: Dabb family protein [Erysipelotrichaceae bacterium]|nr:Dabb family protein [Erysipelotrichaceae bacterium]
MKHYIIVKWNDEVTDKELFYNKAYEAFKNVTDIDEVTGLNVYKNNSDRSNRYDVMIEIECSKQGLLNYDVSTLHKEWKDNYSKYIASKAIFDHD